MWVRRSLQAVHNRPARRIGALLVVVVLALITATSSSAPLPVAGRWPMFRLPSRSGIFGSGRPGRPSWKGVPQQADGSAVGRSHDVTSAATRAATAAGHPRGVGQGELPAYSPYARKFTPGPSVPAQRGFDPKTSVRNAGKSTATSTYYDNADGSYTRKFSLGPVNYRDGQGNWQAIDTNLWSSAGRWRQRASGTDVQFAPAADDAHLVSLDLDGAHSFSYALQGAAHVAGSAASSVLTFPNALPHTDLRLWPTAGGRGEFLKSCKEAQSQESLSSRVRDGHTSFRLRDIVDRMVSVRCCSCPFGSHCSKCGASFAGTRLWSVRPRRARSGNRTLRNRRNLWRI